MPRQRHRRTHETHTDQTLAAEAQNEAAQALAKVRELDSEIAELILTDYIPPAVPPAKHLPAAGAAALDAALASITPKKKAPEPEPIREKAPEIVPGLGAMRPKPKDVEYDDGYDQRKAPTIARGLGSLKKKDEPAPAAVPSWGNGPSF